MKVFTRSLFAAGLSALVLSVVGCGSSGGGPVTEPPAAIHNLSSTTSGSGTATTKQAIAVPQPSSEASSDK